MEASVHYKSLTLRSTIRKKLIIAASFIAIFALICYFSLKGIENEEALISTVPRKHKIDVPFCYETIDMREDEAIFFKANDFCTELESGFRLTAGEQKDFEDTEFDNQISSFILGPRIKLHFCTGEECRNRLVRKNKQMKLVSNNTFETSKTLFWAYFNLDAWDNEITCIYTRPYDPLLSPVVQLYNLPYFKFQFGAWNYEPGEYKFEKIQNSQAFQAPGLQSLEVPFGMKVIAYPGEDFDGGEYEYPSGNHAIVSLKSMKVMDVITKVEGNWVGLGITGGEFTQSFERSFETSEVRETSSTVDNGDAPITLGVGVAFVSAEASFFGSTDILQTSYQSAVTSRESTTKKITCKEKFGTRTQLWVWEFKSYVRNSLYQTIQTLSLQCRSGPNALTPPACIPEKCKDDGNECSTCE